MKFHKLIDLIGLVCEEDVVDSGNAGIDMEDLAAVNNLYGGGSIGVPELAFARLTLIQDGGVHVVVHENSSLFWENAPEYVSISRDLHLLSEYARLYDCCVPAAVVEIGPNCVAPVFNTCINGVCDCVYVLCGAECQLKPCRFAAAVLAFGDDVTAADLYVLTSAYRGVRIVDHECQC